MALSATLRALPPGNETSEKARALLADRNRHVNVLKQRVGLVRAAARYVYRAQPAIARKATSAYERRRRAEARRNEVKKPA